MASVLPKVIQAFVPVPVMGWVAGEPDGPVTWRTALLTPMVVGFKARLTVQDPPLVKVSPVQVSPTIANSGPDTETARAPEARWFRSYRWVLRRGWIGQR